MDEFRSVSRYLKRLTLATAVCCCPVNADNGIPSQSLRGFLQNGWSESGAVVEDEDVAAPFASTPNLVRSGIKLIEVPPLGERQDTAEATSPISKVPRASSSLAVLIQSRATPNQRPAKSFFPDGIRLDVAPSVNRFAVDRKDESSAVTSTDLNEGIKVAVPIRPLQGDSEISGESDIFGLKMFLGNVCPSTTKVGGKVDKTVSDSDLSIDILSKGFAICPSGGRPSKLEVNAAEVQKEEPDDRGAEQSFIPDVSQSVITESPGGLSAGPFQDPLSGQVGQATSSTSFALLESAPEQEGDFGLQRESAIGALAQLPIPTMQPVSLPLASLHSQSKDMQHLNLGMSLQPEQLHQLAQETLRKADDLAARRADHLAKKLATESLQLFIASQDAVEGGDLHVKSLAAAFNAIQESEDFCGCCDAANVNELRRIITSHQTPVLNDFDAGKISLDDAAEVYLHYARQNFVDAAGQMPEATRALVLLGRLETLMSGSEESLTHSVSVTLLRAAIEIDPSNATAYCVLGDTYLEQGHLAQAGWAFQRSVELAPTRETYEGLLEIARRRGAVAAVRVYQAAMDHPGLGNEIPVTQLDAEEFAMTYRPEEMVENSNSTSDNDSNRSHKFQRTGLRSLFPFKRR